MLAIHVDIALCAIPSVGDPLLFDEILRRIIWLNSQRGKTGVQVTRSEHSVGQLSLMYRYPSPEEARAWINLCNLGSVYDPRDVARIFRSLLTKTSDLYATYGFETTQCTDLSIIPDALGNSSLEPTFELTKAAIADVAILNMRFKEVLAVVCSGVVSAVGEFKVRAQPMIRQEGSAHTVSNTILDATIRGVDHKFRTLELNPIQIWERASTVSQLHLAIHIRAEQLIKAAGSIGPVSDFFVGTDFLESIESNQCARGGKFASVALDCCASLVAGKPKYPVAEFRGRSARSDGAKAYRTHITKGGEAMRLMYWQRSDGIELANVGPKGELEIESGQHDKAFSQSY